MLEIKSIKQTFVTTVRDGLSQIASHLTVLRISASSYHCDSIIVSCYREEDIPVFSSLSEEVKYWKDKAAQYKEGLVTHQT